MILEDGTLRAQEVFQKIELRGFELKDGSDVERVIFRKLKDYRKELYSWRSR